MRRIQAFEDTPNAPPMVYAKDFYFSLGDIHGIFYKDNCPYKTFEDAFHAGMEYLNTSNAIGRVWVDYMVED